MVEGFTRWGSIADETIAYLKKFSGRVAIWGLVGDVKNYTALLDYTRPSLTGVGPIHSRFVLIHENGGEVTIVYPNLEELPVSIPYFCWGSPLDPPTMAYRIWCVLNDQPIDYEYRVPEDERAVLSQHEGQQ